MQFSRSHFFWSSVSFGLLAVRSPVGYGQDGLIGNSRPSGQEREVGTTPPGVEILTRGPVHEAFAQPVNLGRGLACVITRHPPEPITETPPDLRPAANNIGWVPGYWMWDGDRDDFLWVSGVWRVPPPGMQWIAGYWAKVSGGYRWAPGFWDQAVARDVRYYPIPPPPLERALPIGAPSANDFWTPGFWRWQETDFAWNAGYWAKAKPGWLWVPSSYSWTPRGYVFSDGYWDYALGNRGLLFAPLAINPAMQNAACVYSPTVAIDPALLSFYLFVRPAYKHYFFGDYFADKYAALGIYPWYEVNRDGDYTYDPLLAYDRWYYGTSDPDWIQNLERWNTYYRQHPEARPPHDLAAEQKMATQIKARADREFALIGRPLGTVWQNSIFPMKLARLSAAERNSVLGTIRLMRASQAQRSQIESVSTGQTLGQSETDVHQPATADIGPQEAPLPRSPQMTISSPEPMQPVGRTRPSITFGQRSSLGSQYAGTTLPADARTTLQSATPRETWKPVLPSDDNPGRPGWNPEPPPATIPEPSARANAGSMDEGHLSVPPRKADAALNPQLRSRLPPGGQPQPGSSRKPGAVPRHPRAPSIESPSHSVGWASRNHTGFDPLNIVA